MIKWKNWQQIDELELRSPDQLDMAQVKEEIKKYQYFFTGSYHQTGATGVPVIYESGIPVTALLFSQRLWAMLMAECWTGYDYIDFYVLQKFNQEKEKFPKE